MKELYQEEEKKEAWFWRGMDFLRLAFNYFDSFFIYIHKLVFILGGIASLILTFVVIAYTTFVCERLLWSTKIKNVKNKHVVVTGGSSGIGKCMAILAAKKGANVTIIARDVQKLEKAKHEILQACKNKNTQKIEYLSLDIGTDYKSIEKGLTDLEDAMGPIYMLVNCAGLAIAGKIEDTTPETLDVMMRTNFLGTYYCTKAVTPRMKASKEGVIVIVSSQAGLLGIFGYTAYCSTKFALRGLAESLTMELQQYNISVTLCLPPDTDTPGYAIEELTKPAETKAICQMAKLIQPEVVAEKAFKDALATNFFSAVGLEGFVMTTLCAGMSPVKSFRQLIVQIYLMGLLRFVSIGYHIFFQKIIAQHKQKNPEKINKEKIN